MIDVTLVFDGLDLSAKLSTYNVTHEVEVSDSITAIDGTEYTAQRIRPTVSFSFIPLTDAQTAAIYEKLSALVGVLTYTDPYLGRDNTIVARANSNLESVFGLRSIDGNRYYKGGKIVLRARTVL